MVKHLALLSPPPPPPPTLRPAKVAVETEPTEPSASPELSDDVPDNGTVPQEDNRGANATAVTVQAHERDVPCKTRASRHE